MSSADTKALRTAVDTAFESEQLPWLQTMVNQPSHSRAREDVEAAGRLLDALAQSIGLQRTAHPDPGQVYADHRVFSTPATAGDDVALALVGHFDTVFPRSTGFLEFRRDPPDSESHGDHIRGPGVLDMKSGLSAIFFALQAVRRAAPERFDQLKLRCVCNSDEEVGSPSSRALIEQLAPLTRAAMVFEAGREQDHIVTTRKGTGSFVITVHGHEAHAGNEHAAGVNAIHALSLLIPSIEALTDYERGTTVNVGIIEGGTAKNTVPGRASCTIDVRVTSLAEAEHVSAAMRALAADPFAGVDPVADKLRKARVEIEGGLLRPPMEASADSQRLRLSYEQWASAEGLGIGEAPLQGGGSDANLFSAGGVPSIDGLGPYGRYFHSPREWSSLDSLRKRTRALACFLAASVAISR